jgi:hypothetical protein
MPIAPYPLDQPGRVGELEAAEEHQHHAYVLLGHKMIIIEAVDHLKAYTEFINAPSEPHCQGASQVGIEHMAIRRR